MQACWSVGVKSSQEAISERKTNLTNNVEVCKRCSNNADSLYVWYALSLLAPDPLRYARVVSPLSGRDCISVNVWGGNCVEL